MFKQSIPKVHITYIKYYLLGKVGTHIFKLYPSTLSKFPLNTFIFFIIKASFYMTFKISPLHSLSDPAAVDSVHTHSPYGNDKVCTVSMFLKKVVYFTNYRKSGMFTHDVLERSHSPLPCCSIISEATCNSY